MGLRTLVFISLLNATSAFAQDFSALQNLDSSKADLSTSHTKRLVYFWATWCPTCREHIKNVLPKLAELNKFDIITLVMDRDLERAQQFVAKEKIKLKTLRDPDRKLTGPLKVFAVPVWAIFERADTKKSDWKLVTIETGSDDAKMLKALGIQE